MIPLKRLIALIVCAIPTIVECQVIDPNFHSPLPVAKAEVSVVRAQPDGKTLVGGYFDFLGNQAVNSLIRLNTDGTLDGSFHFPEAGRNKAISHIELKPNGQFVVDDGMKVFTLDPNGDIVNTFTQSDMEFIRAIKVQPDGKTLVAGFSMIDGDYLRRYNDDGTVDDSFLFSMSVYIATIDLQNGNIIVSDGYGMFLRLDDNGVMDESFYPGPFQVWDIQFPYTLSGIAVQPDGRIVMYNNAYADYDYSYNSITLIRNDGTSETEEAFSEVTRPVVAVRFVNDKIYVHQATEGQILNTPGEIIRLNMDGTIDNSFTPIPATYRMFSESFDVAPDGSIVVANNRLGNPFGIDKFDSNGNRVSAYAPELALLGSIASIRIAENKSLLVSGKFERIGGHFTNNVARLHPDGTVDNSFTVINDNGAAFTAEFAENGSVLVSAESEVFKVDATGAWDQSFSIQRTSDLAQIYKLKVQLDSKIVAIGPNNLYRMLSDGQQDPTFAKGTGGGGPNGGRPDFAVQSDGKILYASVSTNWNGTPIPKFARINVNGSLDTSFPIGSGPNSTASLHTVFATPGDGFILMGFMRTFNGRTIQGNLVKMNGDGTYDEAFMTNYSALPPKSIGFARQTDSGYFRYTIEGEDPDVQTNIDLINLDGTLNEDFHVPAELSLGFQTDVAFDGTGIYIAGDNSVNGSPVLLTRLLQKSVSITGTTITSVTEDTPFQLSAEDILVDGLDDRTGLAIAIQDGEHYTVAGNTITPEQNYDGVLNIAITLIQNSQELASGDVTIDILPVNDKPVIISEKSFQLFEDDSFTLSADNLSYSDPDSDPSQLLLTLADGDHYSVNGTTIIPDENYNGPIQLHVTLRDGLSESDAFTFTADVIPVNDAPTIVSAVKNQKCSQSSPLILSASNFTITDIDSSGPFTINAEAGIGYDIVNGAIVPTSGRQQKLNVSVTAFDGESSSAVYTFEVHVLPSNAQPDQTDMSIWPNPATNILNHQFGTDAPVAITTLYGSPVETEKLRSGVIDISKLPPGVYFLNVVDGAGTKTVHRFMKK